MAIRRKSRAVAFGRTAGDFVGASLLANSSHTYP
jgi:hypothetical protein